MRHRVVVVMLAMMVCVLFATSAWAVPALSDGLDVSHKTDVNRFYPGYWPRWAQSFTASVDGTLDSAVFYLDCDSRLGSNEGTLTAELWAVGGMYGVNSVPTGSPITTSALIAGASLPDGQPGPVTFQFDNSVWLTEGTHYAIAVRFDMKNPTSTLEVARCNDVAAHPGNQSGFTTNYGGAGLWLANPIPADLIFAVYTIDNRMPTELTFTAPAISDFASAEVSGTLTAVGVGPLAGRQVQIQYLSGTQWLNAGDPVSTDAEGRFSRVMGPKSFASYRARYAGDSEYRSAASSVAKVLPKARLTPKTDWSAPTRDKAYTAWGYIEPKHSTSDSNKVKIQVYKRGSDGQYHYLKSFTAAFSYYSSSKTKYAAKVSFGKGKWRIRAYHPSDSKNYKTYGTWDYFTVK
jgi:hypothetical protein